MKNTVSIHQTGKLTVGKFAGLAVLAAFAIAFFALPLTSFAMKGKCGAKPLNGIFMSILTTSPATTGIHLSAPPSFIVDPNTATTLSVGEWIQLKDSTGKTLFGTIIDTKGDVLLTTSVKAKLTGTFPTITTKPAATTTNPLLNSTSTW